VRVLIVEDEAPAARRLQRLVTAELGEAVQIDRAEDVDAARRLLAEHAFAMVLLDLDLAGRDGFELIRGAPGGAARIVVVSAHSDRAIEAFDHAVVDFVSKPVSEPRLALALTRALGPPHPPGELQLLVRSVGQTELVPASAIVRLSGADDYVELSLAGGQRLLHDARLDELERVLPPGFLRVHRCHIVNRAHLVRVRTLATGQRVVDCSDGSAIPVSRRRARAALAALTASAAAPGRDP